MSPWPPPSFNSFTNPFFSTRLDTFTIPTTTKGAMKGENIRMVFWGKVWRTPPHLFFLNVKQGATITTVATVVVFEFLRRPPVAQRDAPPNRLSQSLVRE